MVLPEVISEDPRFMEKDAPPLAEEFPRGAKVFFLGDHAYGVAAQVSEAAEKTLAVMLAVSQIYLRMIHTILTVYPSSFRTKRLKLTSSRQ